jgi:hypothetical protein
MSLRAWLVQALRVAVTATAVVLMCFTAPASQAAAPGSSLLAIEWGQDRSQTLVHVGPVTLAEDGALPLDREANGWVFSPDRSLVAFGGTSTAAARAAVRVVEQQPLRLARVIEFPQPGAFQPLAWLAPDRLLVLRSFLRFSFWLVDPTTGRTVKRIGLRGAVVRVDRTSDALVLLTVPVGKIATPRLLVVDAQAHLRAVTLNRLRAGTRVRRRGDVFRSEIPALAVDPAAGRAYVTGAGKRVAVVDLRDLAVSYKRLAPSSGAIQLLKFVDGWQRNAVWLGNGSYALSGSNAHVTKSRQTSSTPAGLRVVDTRGWTVRTLAAESSWFLAEDDVLAAPQPSSSPSQVITFDFAGHSRQAIGINPGAALQLVGADLYSWDVSAKLMTVIDVASGETVNRVATPYLAFVHRDAAFLY